jgi:hypothetical protein
MDEKENQNEEKVVLCYFLKKYIIALNNISRAIKYSTPSQDEWDNYQTITVEIDRLLSVDSSIESKLYHNEISAFRNAQNRFVKHMKGKTKNKSEKVNYFTELSVATEKLIQKLSM